MYLWRAIRTFAFAAMAGLVVTTLTAADADAQTFTLYAPTSGTDFSPEKIIKGPDGNLWFTTACSNQISKITPNGVITSYTVGTNSLACLNEISVGPDGNIWFTQETNPNLAKITPAGAITFFPVGLNPHSAAAGPDGDIWFADTKGGRIGKMTLSGAVTLYTAGLMSGAGIGNLTTGPDHNVWFLESENTIGKITTGGTVTAYSNGVPADVAFDFMTLGADGNFWVTEQQAGGIVKITTSGQFTQYPVMTASTSLPDYFLAIATGPDGNVWFSDLGDLYFFSMTPQGAVTQYSANLLTLNGTAQIRSMATGPDGNLWLALSAGGGVNPQGAVVKMTLPPPSPLVASILPAARTVKAGTPATLFATMINGGASTLTNCRIGLPADAPAGLQITYQTTDPNTNDPTGQPNTPVQLAANGGAQSFVLTFQSAAPLAATAQPIVFACNGATAAETQWLNTVGLSFTNPAQPAEGDFITSVATTTPGILKVPVNTAGAIAVAMVNNADASYSNDPSVLISVDTGLSGIPVTTTICRTNQSTGACQSPPTASLAPAPFPAGTVETFAVFVTPTGPIPFNPALNRVFVRGYNTNVDAGPSPQGIVNQGGASIAIQTD
jgi:streptogramin lyase